MVKKLYDSSGNYRGFLDDDYIFNTDGKFVGFLDSEDDVYSSSGEFIGGIENDCVVEDILRTRPPKGARIVHAREPTVALPRAPILLSSRYIDGFDKLELDM